MTRGSPSRTYEQRLSAVIAVDTFNNTFSITESQVLCRIYMMTAQHFFGLQLGARALCAYHKEVKPCACLMF